MLIPKKQRLANKQRLPSFPLNYKHSTAQHLTNAYGLLVGVLIRIAKKFVKKPNMPIAKAIKTGHPAILLLVWLVGGN